MVNASPTGISPRRPSLADVARRAGVAVSTASYALRAHPKIPGATRQRVQAAADALGYRINAAIGRLMAELRTDQPASGLTTLAWINCNTQRHAYTALPWLRGWLTGARSRADQLGYRLEEFWLGDPQMNPARLEQILRTRAVPGLLVAPTRATGGIFDLDAAGFSVATMAKTFRQPPFHQAAADDFTNAITAYEGLKGLGYRRIGFFSTPLIGEWTDQRQVGAFLQSTWALPPEQRLPPLVCPEEPPGGPAAFGEWFRRWRPDALLTSSRTTRDWLAAMGVRVPGDCGLAHLNLGSDVPGWTGIDPQVEWIAASAVDMLVGQIHRHETGVPPVPKQLFITGLWREGGTARRQE